MQNEMHLITLKQQRFHPSREMLADLEWWNLFLVSYNGVSLIHSKPQINNPLRFCTDASEISGLRFPSNDRTDEVNNLLLYGLLALKKKTGSVF